ncbi:MAG: HD domain-containing protein [Calditrichae bacterium]|nr:HD domain-containing protein [Calditrichota bacterium]MCB9059548.1 HD domain-containing protein [Calditrichia bacterium]
MSSIEKALIIAANAHTGQIQRNGEPYILHPLRIMLQMETIPEKIAAILHDVIEDSDITLEMLQKEGFSDDVLKTVDLLTHYEKDSYEEYIERLKSFPMARHIKIADLNDNMKIQRLKKVGEKDFQRLEKYHKHWKILIQEENEKA